LPVQLAAKQAINHPSGMTRGKSGFLFELRRRRVLPVAAAYAVGAWALVESSSLLLDTFGAPAAAMRIIIIVAVAGFPVAVMLAWIFDISTDGITRTGDVSGTEAEELPTGASAKKRKLKDAEIILITCLPIQHAASMDPEELSDLRAALATRFAAMTNKYGGLPLLDSGLEFKAVFGYPRQGRGDLQRAIDCALSLASQNGAIPSVGPPGNDRPPRIGLHMGPVLVPKRRPKSGDMPADTALGKTGRFAIRLAHAAPPGNVVLSPVVADKLGDLPPGRELAPLTDQADPEVAGSFLLHSAKE
jgi:hypothetical protein